MLWLLLRELLNERLRGLLRVWLLRMLLLLRAGLLRRVSMLNLIRLSLCVLLRQRQRRIRIT